MSDLFRENVKHGYYVWIGDKKEFIPSLPLDPLIELINNIPFEIREKNVDMIDILTQLEYECEDYEDLLKNTQELREKYCFATDRKILNRFYDLDQLNEWQLQINKLRLELNKKKGL